MEGGPWTNPKESKRIRETADTSRDSRKQGPTHATKGSSRDTSKDRSFRVAREDAFDQVPKRSKVAHDGYISLLCSQVEGASASNTKGPKCTEEAFNFSNQSDSGQRFYEMCYESSTFFSTIALEDVILNCLMSEERLYNVFQEAASARDWKGVYEQKDSFYFKRENVTFGNFSNLHACAFFREYVLYKLTAPSKRKKSSNLEECRWEDFAASSSLLDTIVIWGEVLFSSLSESYQADIQDGHIHSCQYCDLLHFKDGLHSTEPNICRTCNVKRSKVQGDLDGNLCTKVKLNRVPRDVRGMSAIEERLICPITPFMSINRWHGIKQYKLDGNVIVVPNNTLETVVALPQPLTAVTTHLCFLKKTA
jgi:hypothetical protein